MASLKACWVIKASRSSTEDRRQYRPINFSLYAQKWTTYRHTETGKGEVIQYLIIAVIHNSWLLKTPEFIWLVLCCVKPGSLWIIYRTLKYLERLSLFSPEHWQFLPSVLLLMEICGWFISVCRFERNDSMVSNSKFESSKLSKLHPISPTSNWAFGIISVVMRINRVWLFATKQSQQFKQKMICYYLHRFCSIMISISRLTFPLFNTVWSRRGCLASRRVDGSPAAVLVSVIYWSSTGSVIGGRGEGGGKESVDFIRPTELIL